jgi:hypothetical protein
MCTRHRQLSVVNTLQKWDPFAHQQCNNAQGIANHQYHARQHVTHLQLLWMYFPSREKSNWLMPELCLLNLPFLSYWCSTEYR